jgi:hypothetical protein
MSRSLLLVTGAGRSGTSTIAGTLHHLGVHVPGPYLKANESNPRGFYESKWSVDFHNRLLKRANIAIADGRPEAAELMHAAFGDDDATALAGWLDEHAAADGWTAVKDPRTTWTLPRWEAATAALGMNLAYVVMLRHPAEVLGSRATHYGARTDAAEDAFAVKNLAGWINALLTTERSTRGRRRSFLRYDDLLSDWRTAMGRVSAELGLDIPVVPEGEPHPVDEFIDPQLSRHRLTWDDVPVPPELTAVADQVWAACERLAGAGGSHAEAEASMDAAGERYAAMYRAAVQLAQDATTAAVNDARREGRREGRKKAEAAGGPAGEERAQQASRNPGPDKPSLVARITRRAHR